MVRHGDGWFPLMQDADPASVIDHLPTLRQALADAGRAPDSVEVSVYLCPPDADTVCRFRDAGIDPVIFLVAPVARDAALAEVDQRAELMTSC